MIVDGENGFLVEVENVDDLANRIIDLLTNEEKRRQFSYKSKEEIIKKCDLEIISMQYLNLFLNLKK